jgi:hypothetical protein
MGCDFFLELLICVLDRKFLLVVTFPISGFPQSDRIFLLDGSISVDLEGKRLLCRRCLSIYIIASNIIFIYSGISLKGPLHTCYRRNLSSSGYAAHLNCVNTHVIRMSIG